MFDDYKCEKCGRIELYKKPYGESFPEFIEVQCETCDNNCKFKRVWNNKGLVFDVAEGLNGNANTGYASNHTYHPSKYAPKSTQSTSKSGKEFASINNVD